MVKSKLRVLLILLSLAAISLIAHENAKPKAEIIHSDMTFKEAIAGSSAPKEIIDNLILLDVNYYNFDKKYCKGQLVIHKKLAAEVEEVFNIIEENKFPIEKCIPIVKYNWDDNESMAENNTSAFNYRTIAGTNRLSNHSEGRAIDINPFQNPAIYKNGKIAPKGAKYETNQLGTLKDNDKIVSAFKNLGWRWGGDWTSLKDYQHFDKEIK